MIIPKTVKKCSVYQSDEIGPFLEGVHFTTTGIKLNIMLSVKHNVFNAMVKGPGHFVATEGAINSFLTPSVMAEHVVGVCLAITNESLS